MSNIRDYDQITDTQDTDVVYVVRGTGPGSDKHQEKSDLLQEERTRLTTNEGNISTNASDIVTLQANSITGYLHIQDQKASGTAGGTLTVGTWQTRALNTILSNTIAGASLSANQITLPAGTYVVTASVPAYAVNSHKALLYNTTDAISILLGTNAYSNGTYSNQTSSFLLGQFTLAGTRTLEIQHRCGLTKPTEGGGIASSFGVIETYTDIIIKKIG